MAKHDFSKALDLADALAEFANLKSEDVSTFRGLHPNFGPDDWWRDSGPVTGPVIPIYPMWRETQHLIREAWRYGFLPLACIEIIVGPSNISFMSSNVNRATTALNALNNPTMGEVEAFASKFLPAKHQVFDIQLAVMFMFNQPWRAGICHGAPGYPHPEKFFIKSAPSGKACSEQCKKGNISLSKRNWWHDNKKPTKKTKAKKKRMAK